MEWLSHIWNGLGRIKLFLSFGCALCYSSIVLDQHYGMRLKDVQVGSGENFPLVGEVAVWIFIFGIAIHISLPLLRYIVVSLLRTPVEVLSAWLNYWFADEAKPKLREVIWKPWESQWLVGRRAIAELCFALGLLGFSEWYLVDDGVIETVLGVTSRLPWLLESVFGAAFIIVTVAGLWLHSAEKATRRLSREAEAG